MRRWSVVAAMAVVGMGIGTGQAGAEAKRLLGTVRITGPVEAALPGEAWHPLTGGAAVEGMRIRTGPQGVAVVQLSDGDVLGLAESSTCELASGGSSHMRLLDGRLALRLRSDSPLVVDVASAAVRGPAVSPVATGQREALVALTDGTVLVRPYLGTFEVAGPAEGTVTQVAAGQQATIGPQAKAPSVMLASATPGVNPETMSGTKKAEGGFLAALGLSPAAAAAILGSGVAVVGGAVGGAAASGAFSSGSSSDTAGGRQGSPFRPIRH